MDVKYYVTVTNPLSLYLVSKYPRVFLLQFAKDNIISVGL
jgi:hypothetical protein